MDCGWIGICKFFMYFPGNWRLLFRGAGFHHIRGLHEHPRKFPTHSAVTEIDLSDQMTLAGPLLQESTSEVSFSVQQTPPPSNSCGNNWPLAQMQKIKHAGSQGSRPALSVGREVGSLCGETWKILRKCLGLPPYQDLKPPHTHRSLLPTKLSWVPWSPNWWNSSAEAGIQDIH